MQTGGRLSLKQPLPLGNSYYIEGVPTLIIDGWIRVQDLSPQNIETILTSCLSVNGGNRESKGELTFSSLPRQSYIRRHLLGP